jgi:ATP-dependent HslUV protease subunit HslV
VTVIAYRDGVLATDSMQVQGALRVGFHSKIVEAPDGSIGAASGLGSACQAFGKWFQTWNGDHDHVANPFTGGNDWAAMIIRPDLSVWNLDSDLHWHLYHGMRFYADGEGTARCIAIGAMEMGATAEQAVQAAIRHSVHVGGPVCWRKVSEVMF